MEITRKTANKIEDLLIAKSISDKDARELSNQICDLLEGETMINTIPLQSIPKIDLVYTPVNNSIQNTSSEIVESAQVKAKLIPWTILPWKWIINPEGKFVPCDTTALERAEKFNKTNQML